MLRSTLYCAVILAGVAMPAAGSALGRVSVAALSGIEPGEWELRSREPGQAPRRICVRAGDNDLVQPRHAGQSCDRYVAEDRPGQAALSYTCRGTGHGRTVLRVETARLVHIDTQGIANGYPFATQMEGRRIGPCGKLARR